MFLNILCKKWTFRRKSIQSHCKNCIKKITLYMPKIFHSSREYIFPVWGTLFPNARETLIAHHARQYWPPILLTQSDSLSEPPNLAFKQNMCAACLFVPAAAIIYRPRTASRAKLHTAENVYRPCARNLRHVYR